MPKGIGYPIPKKTKSKVKKSIKSRLKSAFEELNPPLAKALKSKKKKK